MLCWVRPHEKKELKEVVHGQFPLVFAKNYEDFKNKITDSDYLVMSYIKVNKKTRQLIQNFPNNKFVFYEIKEKYIMTFIQFDISNEPNIIIGQYSATEIVDNYLGIIPDLYKMRLHQTFKSL
jgi:hypothetical protein